MITLEKLKVYQEFNGDIDGWIKCRNSTDASGITSEDWMLISDLRGACVLAQSDLASPQLREEMEQRLFLLIPDSETRQALRDSASKPRVCS